MEKTFDAAELAHRVIKERYANEEGAIDFAGYVGTDDAVGFAVFYICDQDKDELLNYLSEEEAECHCK